MKNITVYLKGWGKKYGVFLALLGLTLMIFYFHGHPLWKDIGEIREEVEQLEKVLEERETSFSLSLPQVHKEDKEQMEIELENLNLQLYSKNNLQEFFSQMENLLMIRNGENLRLLIGELTSQELKKSENSKENACLGKKELPVEYSYFTIDVSFSAPLEDILLYIKRLENHSPSLQVQQVDLNKRGELYSLSLTLKGLLSSSY